MATAPEFEHIEDHEFKEKEKVYVIDANEYDIYEATIKSIEGLHYTVHYVDYPGEDETLDGTTRILPLSRINTRIFRQQEAARALKPAEGEEEEDELNEPFGGDADDKEEDFKPAAPLENKPKKQKKAKKDKKKKQAPVSRRPEGVRTNPPRNATKVYKDYSDEDSD